MFIDEECENLVVANDGEELPRNINQNKKLEVLDARYLTDIIGELSSPITMWNIVNRLGKHNFSCVSVLNKLKERRFFLIK